MRLSVNFRPYDLERARKERDYAKHFTWGWETVETAHPRYFEHLITNFVWSPMLFADGHRCTESFLSSQFLVLDFDTPEYPLAQAQREWCDQIHWIGTTRNHQREKGGITCDRFRLIAPFTAPISDMRTLRHNHELAIRRYDADPLPKDPARLFFPCQAIVSVQLEGDMQEVKEAPTQRPRRSLPPGAVPWQTLKALSEVVPIGERNTTFYGIAKDLARAGNDEEKILMHILASPTYGGKGSPAIIRELESVVRSAVRSLEREKGKLMNP